MRPRGVHKNNCGGPEAQVHPFPFQKLFAPLFGLESKLHTGLSQWLEAAEALEPFAMLRPIARRR